MGFSSAAVPASTTPIQQRLMDVSLCLFERVACAAAGEAVVGSAAPVAYDDEVHWCSLADPTPLSNVKPAMTRRSTKIWILALAGAAVAFLALVMAGAYWVFRSGVTRPIDNMFGDQHLKTTIALVELHRIRSGVYPASLSELKFIGDWDRIALGSVTYCAADDQRSYFVEVHRGWAGKPSLELPAEFWRNTGFNKSLGPCR
jgi:hypothetical protein